jgi:D-alanyl-lipoteichoic acid acyltransferase DltB (MBOAT superfamily)
MYWEPIYGAVLLISSFIDYWAAIQMAKHTVNSKRRLFLGLSLISNLSILLFFKFSEAIADYVTVSYNLFLHAPESTTLNLLIPIGVSFYTFQTLSYTIDVYRSRRKPERHFGYFALYVSFFPQLVAGPIERSTSLLPQLRAKIKFSATNFITGARLIVWGLFKKLLIADVLVTYVNNVYSDLGDKNGITTLIAVAFFALQLYLDFSAYTDIAIGSARMFGIKLMPNFDSPLLSKSISEFWSKWHISLTSWIFDYLYRPLAREYKIKWKLNILICFLIIGLWHGFSLGFILFGIANGLFYILSYYTLERIEWRFRKPFMIKVFQAAQGFLIVLALSGTAVFFRADNFEDALLGFDNILFKSFDSIQLAFNKVDLIILFISLPVFYFVHLRKIFSPINPFVGIDNKILRFGIYYLLIFMLIIFGDRPQEEFVYFQF